MLRLKLVLVVLCCLVTLPCMIGQQYGHYTQYMLNKYQSNPAFGGLEKSLSIHVANRAQWSKLTANPSQQMISAHMPVYLLNGGIGMLIENDRIGVERNTSIQFSYNHIIQNSWGLLSAGASLGLLRKQIDGDAIITPGGIYIGSSIDHNDPELSASIQNGSAPIWNVGLYFANKYFEGGFSVLNLPAHSTEVNTTNITLNPRYLLYLESSFKPWNQEIILRPSLLALRNSNELQITTSVIGEFGNILAGMGLRGFSKNSIEGLNFIFGTHLNKHLRFTYSYDYGLNSLQALSEGSHELTLNYNLNKIISWGLPPKVIYNPRNL